MDSSNKSQVEQSFSQSLTTLSLLLPEKKVKTNLAPNILGNEFLGGLVNNENLRVMTPECFNALNYTEPSIFSLKGIF